jgi:hypothetical protein
VILRRIKLFICANLTFAVVRCCFLRYSEGMDSQTPLRVEPVQPIVPPNLGQVSAPAVPLAPAATDTSAPSFTPPPAPFIPAAPKPQPLTPASPPLAPVTPPSEPPEPAQAPRSRWGLILIAITFVILAIFVGILIWQRVAPSTAPVLPDYIPGQVENLPSDSLEEDPDVSGDSPDMCTLDAMECPDGTMVGRSGPDCAFVCPDGRTYGGSGNDASLYESLNDTSEGSPDTDTETDESPDTSTDSSDDSDDDNDFTLPEDVREDVEFDNTYHNPNHAITYRFPTVLDVRDTKPYPRSDILFRHGFFDTDINIDDGYVEASSLSLQELLEKTKQEYPDYTVIELSDATYTGDTWKHYAFVQGILTHEHIFMERGGKTFHLWSSGLSYRIAHFAEDIRFTN